MKKRLGLVIAVKLIFILSLCLLLYAVFQVLKAPIEASQALQEWEAKKDTFSAETRLPIEETPLPEGIISPIPENSASKLPYTKGDVIGEISFPSLNKKTAILEGTDPQQLKKGAGHYTGSAAIGSIGNSVLAGHRDTVFRKLGELKIHDLIEVETMDGKFVYEITGSTIVDGDERGAIKPSEDSILTLVTCYPFSYVGPAPDRYLLSAILVR